VLTKQLVGSKKALVGLKEPLVGLAQRLCKDNAQTCRLARRLWGPYKTLGLGSKLEGVFTKQLVQDTEILCLENEALDLSTKQLVIDTA